MSKVTVYLARRVRTMDPGRPIAQAVAVLDGRVLSISTLQSVPPCPVLTEHVVVDTV